MTATVTRIHPDKRGPVLIPHGHVGSHQLVTESGITWQQQDFWARTGRLHPTNPGAPATDRIYPTDEVQVATYTRRLLNAGVQLNTALDAARALVEGQVVSLADGLITIRDPA